MEEIKRDKSKCINKKNHLFTLVDSFLLIRTYTTIPYSFISNIKVFIKNKTSSPENVIPFYYLIKYDKKRYLKTFLKT